MTSAPLTVVTVTYGDRRDLLSDTLNSVIIEPQARIVVVSNGSSPQTLRMLDDFDAAHPRVLERIDLPENHGSAEAFARALERAYDIGAPVLILDDDNPIDADVLRDLRRLATVAERTTDTPLGLVVHRPVNAAQRAIIDGTPASRVFAELTPGAFHGFDLGSRLRARFTRGGCPADPIVRWKSDDRTFHGRRIPVAMWGGVYLTSKAVAIRALPNPELVLYGDDNDFSRVFRERTGELFLVEELTIRDTDVWRPATDRRRTWRSRFPSTFRTPDAKVWRLQYLFRNQAYLSARQARISVAARMRLAVNATIRITAVALLALLAGRPVLAWRLTGASIAGLRGRLGRTYPLP